MKKYFVFLHALLLYYGSAVGQVIYNGNFAINNGNTDGYCDNIPIVYSPIIDGCANWRPLTGTPRFDPTTSTPNDIEMYWEAETTEGIIGGYPFKANKTYFIHIGLTSPQSHIILIANNLHLPVLNTCVNTDCTLSPQDGWSGIDYQILILNSTTTPLEQVVPHTVFTNGDNAFEYTPAFDYDELAIFPFGSFNEGQCYGYNDLNYVQITRKCDDDLYVIDANLTEEIYSYARHIYIGSFSSSAITVANDHTTVEATESIQLSRNFEVVSGVFNGPFLAQINPYACDKFPPGTFDDEPPAENKTHTVANDMLYQNHHANSRDFSNKELISEPKEIISQVKITPNPNPGTFTLNTNNISEGTLQIQNMFGQTVYSTPITSNKTDIALSDEFLQGTYMIRVTGPNLNHSEKIVIVK